MTELSDVIRPGVPTQAIAKLFSIMRGKSKSIGKRSMPAVLSTVGRENFEKLQSINRWSDLKYVVASGVRNQFAVYDHDPAGLKITDKFRDNLREDNGKLMRCRHCSLAKNLEYAEEKPSHDYPF